MLTVLVLDHSSKCGIAAYAIIVAVGTDEPAVQTYVHSVCCGNEAQFSTHKVCLGHTVLLVQICHNHQLHLIGGGSLLAVLFKIRRTCDQNIQSFAGERLTKGLGVLILCQVGQKIGDAEYGITRVVADAYVNTLTVCLDHGAVQSQRNGDPLILTDTAVVVGFEIAQTVALVQRMLFQIQAGGIDVGSGNAHAALNGLGACTDNIEALLPVVVVQLIACGDRLTQLVLTEAFLLEDTDSSHQRLALGLTVVQELHVIHTVLLCCFSFLGAPGFKSIFLLVEEGFRQILAFCLLAHSKHPFLDIIIEFIDNTTVCKPRLRHSLFSRISPFHGTVYAQDCRPRP